MLIAQLVLGCALAAPVPAGSAFEPLLDHVSRHRGIWGIENAQAAAIFYRCLDSIPEDDRAKAVVAFVGSHEERAYWIAAFLTEESYLHGHRPRPYLALAIYANASERLRHEPRPSQRDLRTAYTLNICAAILARRLEFEAMAITFKARAESAPRTIKEIGGPAVGNEGDRIYESIPARDSEPR